MYAAGVRVRPTRSIRVLAIATLTIALTMAGPIGWGAVAATTAGAGESQLERAVDSLSAGERARLVSSLADGLEAAGVDLGDPQVQARLADTLGVARAEIAQAAREANGPGEGPPISLPIVFLFVAAALIFAPDVFRAIAGTLFGEDTESVEGIEQFGG
jgi:hypothetical protein